MEQLTREFMEAIQKVIGDHGYSFRVIATPIYPPDGGPRESYSLQFILTTDTK